MYEIKNYFDFKNEEIKDYLVKFVLSKRMDIADKICFLSDAGDEIGYISIIVKNEEFR